MDKKLINNEIEKYLIDGRHPLSKLLKLQIERKDDGLVPTSLRSIVIDEDSIVELEKGTLYRFTATGDVLFHDPASNIDSIKSMLLSGVAQISSIEGREYASSVVIDMMHEA